MNIDADLNNATNATSATNSHLLRLSSPALQKLLTKAEELDGALAALAGIGDEGIARSALRLQQQLAAFEPSITMIGQVKAGKTSLVNAMVGWPDLLPADVNPWTSVVTSLHMSRRPRPDGNSASFRFFDQREWDRLLDKGGRIGELASRAGADEELELVRQQIETMREKSRARLGRKFELLLGQVHDYGYFDQDLIERYVCLGDDFGDDPDVSENQGRFADITKSADLYFHRPEFPMNLCIRDTPGVNDTFMMREQITIRAIRDSRICVVVLSAHQALSSVDMALIRLISNIRSREVVIFVNRIDELSDPARQVPEIRQSIRATLRAHEGPVDAEIVFGSAYWANKALTGSLDQLARDSAESLFNWAESELRDAPDDQSPAEMIWNLSGLPALFSALADRIAEGVARETVDRIARAGINLANGIQVAENVAQHRGELELADHVNKDGLARNLDEVEARALNELSTVLTKHIEHLADRIDRSHKSFLERATAALISHLERYGEDAVWKYDPMGLRVLLRSSYQLFGKRTQNSARSVYQAAAEEIAGIYARTFGESGTAFAVEPPPLPRVPPPVFLGQTIALDMHGSWWKSWWRRRRGYSAYASNFYNMILEETDPIVTELRERQANSIREEATNILRGFFVEQRDILLSVAERADASPDELSELLGDIDPRERQKTVETTLTALNQYVA